MQTYHALQETGTIAILRGWSCIQAMPLVQALYAGGIRMAEVAVDNLDAFETVAKLRKIWAVSYTHLTLPTTERV